MKKMFKKCLIYLLLAVMLVPAWAITGLTTAKAAPDPTPIVVAGWSFPTGVNSQLADDGILPNKGIAEITASVLNNFGSISYTAAADTDAITGTHWNSSFITNNYWDVNISTVGMKTLKLSSIQNSSSKGPSDFKIQYRVGAKSSFGQFIDLAQVTPVKTDWTGGTVSNLVLPDECNDQSNISIRWTVASLAPIVGVLGEQISPTATSSIDDIVVTGQDMAVPTGTIAYSTTAPTQNNVTATLTPSEHVTVTSVGGFTHTFTDNGFFLFTFVDDQGTAGSELATVSNIDKTAPVITLNGPDFLVIGDNSNYVEQGATALDQHDGDLTASVVTSIIKFQPETGQFDLPVENIDSTQTGIYLVEYSVSDSAQNIAVELRMVFVQPVGNAQINLPFFMDGDGNLVSDLRADFQNNKQTLISLFLENGTAISGDQWNGVFNLPGLVDLGTVTLPVDSGYSVTDAQTFEIGGGTTSLVLDGHPAKAVFYGKAGYKVGFIDQTGAFSAIANTCVFAAGQTIPTLVAGQACKVDSGADLVVWTTHFTKFVTYNTAVVTTPVFTVSGNGQTITVKWQGTGADSYTVSINGTIYTVAGGNDLGTAYVENYSFSNYGSFAVLVRAVKNGVYSVNTTSTSITLTAPAQPTPAATGLLAKAEAAPVAVAPVATVTPPAATTTPTPATDNTIKNDTTAPTSSDDNNINWTPWIILFILILLAGAATGGYFYWFAGKETEEKNAKVVEPKKVEQVVKKAKSTVVVRDNSKNAKKKGKRW